MSSEHLSSVHNNPFILQFGLPHHASRQDTAECSVPSSTASSERGDDDTDQEYHVNSGFVNKLRSKFAQLENKGHKVSLSRKSASVENLLALGSQNENSYKGRMWLQDDSTVSNLEKAEMRKPAGYRPQIRPRSYDLLESSASSKPKFPQKKKEVDILKQTHLQSVKPPVPRKTSAGTTTSSSNTKYKNLYRKSSSDSVVPKPEHHDWKVAPDLEKIGRDNIVIIEHEDTAVSAQKDKVKDKTEAVDEVDSFMHVKPVTEKNRVSDENELPKPNTVSQFRTLFEKPGKAPKPLNVWRPHSPTRKSNSGNNSPSVTSPRSPLTKVNDDNVFEDSSNVTIRYDHDRSVSPRNSSNIDTNLSPRNSKSLVDYEQNVDTNSASMQKSLDVFSKKSSVDRRNKLAENSSVENRSSLDMTVDQPLSPGAQRALSPVHPLSNIFDSKSLAKDKPKRPKPHVAIKRQNSIPKDTIELKHETDRLIDEKLAMEEKVVVEKKPADKKPTKSEEEFSFEGISNESTVKPSTKKSGKISPRKTNIFDSSKMVKKDKEAPRTPVSPVENVPFFSSNVPKQVKVRDNVNKLTKVKTDNENETQTSVEVSLTHPPKKTSEPSTNGMSEIKPVIVPIDKSENKGKPRIFKVKEQNFAKPEIPTILNDTERVKPAVENDNNEQVVSGMSSFLASRLKKTQPGQENQLKTSSVHLANGSLPSPVPRKRQAPSVPVPNGSVTQVEMETNKEAPPLPNTPQPELAKSNTGVVISRKKKPQSATKMVFDSSKIVTKRKEPPKRKPARKTLEQLNQNITFDSDSPVPKLDLSSITEPSSTEYQEGYIPTVIKPCNIKFIGAEIIFDNSPYKKKGKVKKVRQV